MLRKTPDKGSVYLQWGSSMQVSHVPHKRASQFLLLIKTAPKTILRIRTKGWERGAQESIKPTRLLCWQVPWKDRAVGKVWIILTLLISFLQRSRSHFLFNSTLQGSAISTWVLIGFSAGQILRTWRIGRAMISLPIMRGHRVLQSHLQRWWI